MHTSLALLCCYTVHISTENQTRAEESTTFFFFPMVKMDSEQTPTKTQRKSEISPSVWFEIK